MEWAHAKPSPDIICAILGNSELDRDSCIMVGDTPYDISPALQVGTAIIAVLSGGYSRAELEGAAEIYQDIGQLEEQSQVSPAWK
ncbi:MAG: hypothetical protein A2V52_04965 [Actinobacteria bacterium RBG_19FT_COMBO_54_7]|uniref:HAD family hydrolase n=1 Tax=Candidatus Solincola sediminis TaxID=1797199 RepID=A0A1F2WRL1_9ACTN|nr:MAG: hypothetical protein A2Y75_11455 [Candidatus Solincola sediminis]OFW69939.1 MAG: hypothetical protein A2V52_04965 [Actinobacteria bacterium RBG_19FT_COMBO_54_7]